MAPEQSPPSEIVVEGVHFPLVLKSPKSSKNLFLAGAGHRSVQINPELTIKVTCLGFYFEEEIVKYLSEKWSGKSSSELLNDEQFFADIIASPYEKITRVTMLKPLPGAEFARKVTENIKQVLLEAGKLGPEEEQGIHKFQEVFKDQNFVPGSGPHFLSTSSGLEVGFSTPSEGNPEISTLIGSKKVAEALMSTMIGKNPVSPAAKESIAEQLSAFLTKAA